MKTKIIISIICLFISTRVFAQLNGISNLADVREDTTCLVYQHGSSKAKNVAVSDNSPNQNYAGYFDIRAVAWTLSGNPFVDRTYFYFNLDLDSGTIIQHAYLSLYNNPNSTANSGQHSSLSGSNQSVINRVIAPWEENTITWNNQPPVDTVHKVILPQSTSPNQNYLDINVTDLVQDMVSHPTLYFGFMLQLQTEEYYRCLVFASSNNADSSLHPKLDFCYSVPTSVGNIYPSEEFKIYPTPCSGIFFVTELSRNDFNLLQIVNCFGQVVFDQSIALAEKNLTVNLEDKPKGIYFVVLSGTDQRLAKKIIIQ
jgi:hypothetical protein